MIHFIQAIDALKGTQKQEKSKPASWTKGRKDWEPRTSQASHAHIKAQRV